MAFMRLHLSALEIRKHGKRKLLKPGLKYVGKNPLKTLVREKGPMGR